MKPILKETAMKRSAAVFILSTLFLFVLGQSVPFNTVPDWESTPLGNVATGLGLADIDGDGWKDLVVANGNDILRQPLYVYHNNGDGTFPLSPTWVSEDVDYHGHLAVGDVDGDGDIDVAVSVYIGPSGFSSPGKVKVYYNDNGTLEGTPSFQSDPFYTFSCALGDADGDGDLDLAAAAGEPYSQLEDYGKVFLNNDGVFSASPDWESDILMGALDVEFGDFNLDGSLDLMFVCEYSDSYIYLADDQGVISTTPAWQSGEGENFINSVDIGYWNDPRETVVVMTENDQLGGEGRVRMYEFGGAIPATSQASWYSSPFGYGSGILLCDVTGDEVLDLIYGGWWKPVKISEGDGSGFAAPSYTSSTNSVVEAIQMSDLGQESVLQKTETFLILPQMDGRNLLILEEQLVEEIIAIRRNDILLSDADYSRAINKNWIAMADPLLHPESIEVEYTYSPHPDMVITNWDTGKGNYIFYNTNIPVGTYANGEPDLTNISVRTWPVPARDEISVEIRSAVAGNHAIRLTDLTGKTISLFGAEVPTARPATFIIGIEGIPAGVYLLEISGPSGISTSKIIVE